MCNPLKLIGDGHVRALALETIGALQARRKQPEAGATLDRAEEEARGLTGERERADILERLAATRAQFQDVDRALALANQNPSPASRGRTLEQILGLLAFQGEADRAYRIAEEQSAPIVRAYAWLGIAEGIMGRIEQDRLAASKKK